MRTRFIVSYDISDPKRLRLVYKTMRGFGDHIQYSVFRCDLSPSEKVELIGAIGAIINHDQDQVLLIAIGPPDGRGKAYIDALGRPYTCAERHAVVI